MLVILADDLTGTLDCAAPFAGRGLHTEIALSEEAIGKALEAAPAVLSVNLGSREVEAATARDLTRAALSRLPADAVLFKKVDSRLKGNIAAELEAMQFGRALVAPAIPDFGRVVRSGHVDGFGVSVPIAIADVLGAHATRALVPDTVSQDDMHAALDLARAEKVDLMIGARGLAEALASRMTGLLSASPAPVPPGPVLFVVGSHDPITMAQIDNLRESMPLDYLAAPDGHVPIGGERKSAITLVQATPGGGSDSPMLVSQRMAAGVVPELTSAASTLLLCGGATAEAVLTAMTVTRFRLLGECLPGLGLAYVNGQCIIAKSGGFGAPDTLCRIATAGLDGKV